VAHAPRPDGRPEVDLVPQQRVLMSASDIARAVTRIGYEILERNKGAAGIVLLGVPRRGVTLAHRLAAQIAAVEAHVPVGSLDITMYRDDLRLRPARALEPTEIPPEGIDGSTVVLVDDVLYSGRTCARRSTRSTTSAARAACSSLCWSIAGTGDLPIRPDYVGKNVPTSRDEQVRVQLAEIDGTDEVVLTRGGHDAAPALGRRPERRRRRHDPRHHRRAGSAHRPGDQEAAHPARPHRGEPVLRGLHPHPHLVRGWRPSGCPPTSSTSRERVESCPRARASRTPRSRSRRWAPTPSSSGTPPAAHRTASPTPAGCRP
jgi:pyrimidine operon attenuation protein / uracil phosphoribosyltransferase